MPAIRGQSIESEPVNISVGIDHLLADQSQLASSNVISNVDDDEIDGNLLL